MNIELNLSNHAIGQLNMRYPNWKTEEIQYALKTQPTFRDGDEYHTYYGTGFDIYEGSNNTPRKRYQRRHLFIVSKKLKDTWIQKTVVFHTNLTIAKRIMKPTTIVYNSCKRLDGDWVKVAPDVYKMLSDDPLNSIRNDIQWNYADRMFITTNTLN